MAHPCWPAALATVATLLCPIVGATQTPSAATDTRAPEFRVQVWGERLPEFTSRIDGYVELRGRLRQQLPPVIVTNDTRQITRGQRSLARAIRAARPGAAQGAFFNDATSAELKRSLAEIMTPQVWAVIMDDNPGSTRTAIDGAYPEGKSFSSMPGIVLAHLPPLPDDLEFRFLGPHLVLYDLSADTIVDRLPNAIECHHCDD